MTSKNVIIPDDYKDVIYRITYFILGKFAKYIPRAIKPNYITTAAFISAIFGTILLLVVSSPVAYLYWILFNFIWYLLDALDGIHARLTQQSSEFGGFLDHAFDNLYFIFMFTVFSIKFELAHTFYIYVMLVRVTAALMVFTVQYHTKRLYLPRFSGGLELLMFTFAMLLFYFFPHFNPINYTTNPWLLYLIHIFSLEHGLFMKLVFMVYAIGVPINFIFQFRFVKRELSRARSKRSE